MKIITLTIQSSKKTPVYVVVEHIEFICSEERGTLVMLKAHNNGGLPVSESAKQVLALMLNGPYYGETN